MFYTIADGNFTNINCQQTSNSEVSGFGIRYTHYLQALLSILLAFKQPTPAAMLFNNLASPAVSIFLVASVGFYSSQPFRRNVFGLQQLSPRLLH